MDANLIKKIKTCIKIMIYDVNLVWNMNIR